MRLVQWRVVHRLGDDLRAVDEYAVPLLRDRLHACGDPIAERFRVGAVEHGWVCGSGLCHEKRSARAREPQPPLRRSVLFAGNRDQQLPYIDRTTPDAIPSSCRSLLGRGLRRAAVHRHHDLQHSGIDRKLWCAGRRLSLTCVVSLKEYSRGHAEPLCKSFRLAYVDFASTRQDL